MRYFIGALPGVAVAFSCLLWRHFHNIYRVSTGVLVLLAACGAANQWTIVRHPESIAPYGLEFATRQYLRLEDGEVTGSRSRYSQILVFTWKLHTMQSPRIVFSCLVPMRRRKQTSSTY